MFIRSVILLFSFYVAVIEGQAQGSGRADWPGYEHVPRLSGWLKLHPEPADWKNATRNCLAEDAQLASPWTDAFTSAVNSLQARADLALLYSGLHATLPFVNGEPPLSLALSSLERCGVFRANGSLGDVACLERLPYACYAPAPQAPPLGCSSKDGRPGYSYAASLRGCLKLHARAAAWRDARLACRLEGAFLASPWNEEFVSAISELQRTMQGAPLYSGLLTTFAEGAFNYVDGVASISLEPEVLSRAERCGVFLANGTSGAVPCRTRLPFVCYAPAPADTTTTIAPRTRPTQAPTQAPSQVPTLAPTQPPTLAPTQAPTLAPTQPPTLAPTQAPTLAPTQPPTLAPTQAPTLAPTQAPTQPPTQAPTQAPTQTTTQAPRQAPTQTTTQAPMEAPTAAPTVGPTPVAANCTDESRGYMLEARFGHCYKFHGQARNWTAANVSCAAEGARLAVPNSRQEALHLKELLAAALRAGAIRGAGFNGAVALGIYYEDGVWKTVDGQLLSEAGYAAWWPGWPRGSERAPRGFMESTGQLENYSLFIKTAFICEKAN